jgi:DNA-binding FadR family transcriptional regulator
VSDFVPSGGPTEQLRQPRLAEMVADVLRRRVMSGALPDGSMLPKQEDLLAEFRVSKPSMREALRILETEGLITVRRGNMGGAVVHSPQAGGVAYMLSLVMQTRGVPLSDVGNALKQMEPACAALCAEREDRAESVLPALREVHRASLECGEPVELTRLSRRFHEVLVECCGNETMILVVGALESLWTAHQHDWAGSATAADAFSTEEPGRASRQAHARIIKLVEDGNAEGVARLVRRHLEGSVFYEQSVSLSQSVRADALKSLQGGPHS